MQFKKQEAQGILNKIKKERSSYWKRIQEQKTIELFHQVAQQVPAYKDFLKKNKIDHEKINTSQDFLSIPPISKKNYIRNYPLKDLCWDGNINKPLVLTATSGSTGEPSYFVRGEDLDSQYSIFIQNYLQNASLKSESPILVIICFGMGIWIGGVITYKAYEIAAIRENMPISIITPGINKKEIFSALKKLSPQYNQTILVGYAPFLKDIVDQSEIEGINLKNLNIRFMFAAESVTEEVRDYLYENAGVKNIYRDFMNIYGSADIGAMAFEDTTSILIKRLIQKDKSIFYDIFSPINKIPTLAQYNPLCVSFEAIESEILLTGNSAIPLVRYSIGDNGGVLTYDEMSLKLQQHNIHITNEAKKYHLEDSISELPFVFVYERMDFSTTLYGLNIFPEWIKRAIVSSDLNHFLTGKFTLITKYDSDKNQYLEVNVELKRGMTVTEAVRRKATHILVKQLMHASSEYRELINHLKERAHPRIEFWPPEDPLYFQPGIKQKWVK